MYWYIQYAYISYKLYEYTSILDTVYSAGRRIKSIYDWCYGSSKIKNNNTDLDWILISAPDLSLKNSHED